MKQYIIFALLLMLNLSALNYSQEYLKLMEDPNANFYDIQRSFYNYWEGKTPERGQGWMVFKRWEYFMEERVYPGGKLPDPAITYKEITKYRETHRDNINDLSNWVPLGPSSWLSTSYNPGIGRINCILQHPTNSSILYAGAPSGGLWKSTNAGVNWATATDNLQVLGVSSIIIDPINNDIMYILTGDGDGGANYSIGVLKSTNGGANWNTTGLSFVVSSGLRFYKMVMHPSNNNILLAVGNAGVYRTADAGNNWTSVIGGVFRDIEFNPSNHNIIYASGNTFIKSTDAGSTFLPSGTGLPTSAQTNRMAIGVSPANSNYVYILASSASNSGFYGFYRSTDQGNNFVLTVNTPNILGYAIDGSSSGGQGTYDLAIAVSPVNINEVYTGGINVWKSTNGGNSFSISSHWVYPPTVSQYVHADVHTLDFFGSTLYAGCDGGLFRTTNGGTNWSDISAGMSTTQFYRFGGTPQNPNYLIGGTQDNGTNRMDGTVWTHVLGADGMEAAIDPTNQNILYACIQNGGLRRSVNGGNSFTSIVNNITGTGYWVTPYVLDPVNNQTLYAGYQDIWKSTDMGGFWTQISSFGGSSFRSIAVSYSNPAYIYAATANTIYRTTNGGTNWTDITAGLPGNSMTYIAVNKYVPEEVYVTFSGYSAGNKVYQSTNAGTNWTNISGSLPNLPANCVTFLKRNSLFIGMDVGVYYRDDNTGDWIPFMTNLPNVIVREMEVDMQANKLRAATYGRGMWETIIPELLGISTANTNVPEKFELHQNYPNPFNPSTVISFNVPYKTFITMKVYDILGKEVKTLVNSFVEPGRKSVMWNGKDDNGRQLSSGIYIYEIRADNFRESKKLILLK